MPDRRTSISATQTDLLDGLVQVSFEVMAMLTQVAASHDLSLTQLRVLAILRDNEPTMSQLAEHLGLDRSTVSGLIDRATKRGLVERVASATDGRSTRVSLTNSGRAFAREVEPDIVARLASLTGSLTNEEQAHISELLFRMLPGGRRD